jgi:glutamate-1-semialdehyde 2,1-aminomutase
MLNGGVYLPCSQFEAMFVSAAHTEELIDEVTRVAGRAFSDSQQKT